MSDKGILIVISGPSGAGKGTICAELRKQMPNLVYSVSMTTRQPRVGEEEGISYFFRDVDTSKEHVMNLLEEGKSVILEIDIQGAMKVKESYSDAVFIYVVPPSLDVLTSRLHGRGTDDKEVIHKRLSLACSELALAHRYDYIVVNDDLEDAIERTASILRAETCKISRNKEKIQYIYKRYSNEQEQQ